MQTNKLLFIFQTCQQPHPLYCHRRPCQARPPHLPSKMDPPRRCPRPQEPHLWAHHGHPEVNNPVRPLMG